VANHLFIGIQVVVPVLPLVDVLGVELPVLVGPVEPHQEPLPLLLPPNVEGELSDFDPVSRQVVLVGTDIREALLPDVTFKQRFRNTFVRQQARVDSND
jgi:hypothetical protein